MTLHPLDWTIVGAFFAFQAYLGFRSRRVPRRMDAADYLLGGRRLTLPVFVASLVSTWYGGILGVGEYSFKYGISNWLVFGVPYYLWATIFALFLARPTRRTHFISLPDHLGAAYGRTPALMGAIIVFVMTVPAAYVLILGDLGRMLLNWPTWVGATLSVVLSSVYLITGGFRSAVRVDVLQFLCMLVGFALILPFAFHQYGGWSFIAGHVPATHLTWHGGNSGWFVLSWYFIAATTMVEPAFYQRCYATETEQIARKGIFWSIAFWVVFDFMTTTAGLYARAAIADLRDPKTAYVALATRLLPPGVLGLFMVGVIATAVSTVDSYMFISATALGRDLLSRLRPLTDHGVKTATRWGVVVSSASAVTLALSSTSVIALWRDLGSIGVPALLLPVIASFVPRLRRPPARAVIFWIACPATVAALWIGTRIVRGSYPYGIEPIFPALMVSIAFAVALIRTKSGARGS
ncbi:MAG: sodium:solute symporter family protein [Candidatus Zixiibacteriota bacterium]